MRKCLEPLDAVLAAFEPASLHPAHQLLCCAATLIEDTETLEDVGEPYPLKTGFVQRAASGRKIDASALTHLDLRAGGGPQRQERLF